MYDQEDDFSKYKIYKGNVTIIILKKEQDGKDGSCIANSAVLFNQCQKRYSLRYVNDTYVSFRLRNVTLQDSGRYLCQAYFGGVSRDPEYAEINFSVQGNSFCKSLCQQKSKTSGAPFIFSCLIKR